MEIPKIGNGKFVIIIADFMTGHILNYDGSLYTGKGNDYFLIMENESLAIKYAKNKLKVNKKIEILLYDDKGECKQIFRPEG